MADIDKQPNGCRCCHADQRKEEQTDSAAIRSENCIAQDVLDNAETEVPEAGRYDAASSSGTRLQPFWIEEDWTLEDEASAQKVIDRNRQQCQIPDGFLIRSKTKRNKRLGRIDWTDTQAWDEFYQHNQANFFKDRHYLATAFPCEFGSEDSIVVENATSDDLFSTMRSSIVARRKTLVELGCGVGNTLLPLLEASSNSNTAWTVYGLDLSAVAIDLLQQDYRFQAAAKQQRAFAMVVDLSRPDAFPTALHGVADVTTMLFCLSAMDPDVGQIYAAQAAASSLKPGGVLVFRDYGRYDQAQLQLATQKHKLLPSQSTRHACHCGIEDAPRDFYRKHDGTKCYYFTTEALHHLFVVHAGLELIELHYLRRTYINQRAQTQRRRIWVQARFRKPKPAPLP